MSRSSERNEAFAALQKSQQVSPTTWPRPRRMSARSCPRPQSLGGDSGRLAVHPLGGTRWRRLRLPRSRCRHFAVYLLDVCGHGVGAALLSVSALNAIRSEALPQTDFHRPGGVLAALNKAFPMERQNDMFFTAWYGVFHRPSRRLRWAGGGHPPALLLPGARRAAAARVGGAADRGGRRARVHRRRGGGAGRDRACSSTATGPSRSAFRTGGCGPSRTSWRPWRRPRPTVGPLPAPAIDRMDVLLGHVRDLAGHEDFHDDFSMVELVLG